MFELFILYCTGSLFLAFIFFVSIMSEVVAVGRYKYSEQEFLDQRKQQARDSIKWSLGAMLVMPITWPLLMLVGIIAYVGFVSYEFLITFFKGVRRIVG